MSTNTEAKVQSDSFDEEGYTVTGVISWLMQVSDDRSHSLFEQEETSGGRTVDNKTDAFGEDDVELTVSQAK